MLLPTVTTVCIYADANKHFDEASISAVVIMESRLKNIKTVGYGLEAIQWLKHSFLQKNILLMNASKCISFYHLYIPLYLEKVVFCIIRVTVEYSKALELQLPTHGESPTDSGTSLSKFTNKTMKSVLCICIHEMY